MSPLSGLLPRVPSGVDRGKSWDRISLQSLNEMVRDRDADIRFSAQTELVRRGEAVPHDQKKLAQPTLL